MGIRKRKEAWADIKRPVTNQKHSDNTLRKNEREKWKKKRKEENEMTPKGKRKKKEKRKEKKKEREEGNKNPNRINQGKHLLSTNRTWASQEKGLTLKQDNTKTNM